MESLTRISSPNDGTKKRYYDQLGIQRSIPKQLRRLLSNSNDPRITDEFDEDQIPSQEGNVIEKVSTALARLTNNQRQSLLYKPDNVFKNHSFQRVTLPGENVPTLDGNHFPLDRNFHTKQQILDGLDIRPEEFAEYQNSIEV